MAVLRVDMETGTGMDLVAAPRAPVVPEMKCMAGVVDLTRLDLLLDLHQQELEHQAPKLAKRLNTAPVAVTLDTAAMAMVAVMEE